MYATGLRVSEVCALRVADIDSAPDRMCVRVNAGKGGADRLSVLSASLLELLTPLGGPAQVLEYLSRYTHRTAIGNERIRAITHDSVVFAVRADDKAGKRAVRLDGPKFVRRFMQHILPTGIQRIRHYGVLASACKAVKLAQARAALAMPAPNPLALESAAGFLARVARIDAAACPCCIAGRLRVVQVTVGPRRLPAVSMAAPGTGCRGPP